MSQVQHVEIDMTAPGRGTVKFDGVEVQRVRSVKFSAGVDEVNLVTLTILPDRVTVTGGPCETEVSA